MVVQTYKSINKLLSPIPHDRGLFWRSITLYGSWAIYPIFNVFMLTKITGFFETQNMEMLQTSLIFYAVFFFVFQILEFSIRNWGWTESVAGYKKAIHREYMKKFIYLDNQGYEIIGTGKLISIIEKGFSMRGNLLDQLLEHGIAMLLTLLYVSYVFYELGTIYFISYIICLVLISGLAYIMNTYMLRARRKRVAAANMYVKYLIKIIMSKVELMQYGIPKQDIEKLDQEMDNAKEANIGMNPYIHFFFFGPNFIIGILRLLIFFIFGWGLFQLEFSFTELVSLGASLVLLDEVMSKGLTFYKDITKHFDIVQKLWTTFDDLSTDVQYDTGETFVYETGNISIKGVSFGYNDSLIFKDLGLDIQGAKKTAFVGVSGTGKSTLVKLIAGYLHPQEGEIYIDGQLLSSLALNTYYKHIGFLTQEPGVFDGTIRENLNYLGEDVSQNIESALRLAKCDFVFDFPDGLQTEIGERGIRLSGGQRQRLAIAKIFLKNPEIIILDEPTSALDSFHEEAITDAMNNLFAGRTVLIIAHRLQTVKAADDIIVLDEGKILERGTHDDLVKQGGHYAKMLELQSGF